jgi:signal transduction histidine kinase
MVIPLGKRVAGHLEPPICIEKWPRDLAIPHVAELIDQEGIVSSLAAPMWSKGRLYGYVGIMMRQHRRCPKEEVELFTRLVLQVVAAIENAELYQQVRHVAVLQERDRLAREMHDNLAQMLGYVNIKASITDDLLAKNQVTQARYSLLELKQVAKDAYTDVREAIFNLRTPMSGGNGLVGLLEEYLAEYRAHYGIDANLIIENGWLTRFPAEVEVQVNRIIQEALTNVRKHAEAKHVWVRFERNDNHVRIRIEDDGIGFDPANLKRNGAQHFGLQIMRERAESVGGELEIDSRPGAGTQVLLQVAMFPTFEDSHEGS